MTDTATQEAPARPAKRGMSEEHKRKLAEGRARARAAKSAAQPVPPSPAAPAVEVAPPSDLQAEVERLRAEIAALKPTPEQLAALPAAECFVELVADKKDENGNPLGEKLVSSDDPRWDELAKYSRPIHGSLIVDALTRDKRGEVIDRKTIHAMQFRKADIAREFMRKFAAMDRDVTRVLKA